MADVELKHTQADVAKLQYMTVDEVRAQSESQLDPLPNGEGAKLKSQSFQQGEQGEGYFVQRYGKKGASNEPPHTDH